jgi:hypothetical protein
MSYAIEYTKRLYTLPKEKSFEQNYLALVKIGDNNCYETTTNRRVRDWQFFESGWKYNIIKKVCDWAGECEGGSLQPRGRWTTPENYLKSWRKMFNNIQPFSCFLREFTTREGIIYLKHKHMKHLSEYAKEELKEFLLKDDKWSKSYNENEDETTMKIQIEKPEDIEEWQRRKNCFKEAAWGTLHLRSPSDF